MLEEVYEAFYKAWNDIIRYMKEIEDKIGPERFAAVASRLEPQ